MKMRTMAVVMLCLVMFAFFGCSKSNDPDDNDGPEPTEESIGPEGGTIEIDGFISLDIPVGALSDTVDFTIERNDSPDPVGGSLAFATDVFSVGPSGTEFDSLATVTIEYEESDLGGSDESEIVIYTNDGSGWSPLATTVDVGSNEISASITHLSDYAAVVDTAGPASGIFAMLQIYRYYMGMIVGPDTVVIRMDNIEAWFDNNYAPCEPISPNYAGEVSCNAFDLVWNVGEGRYHYDAGMMAPFIELGETYDFDVEGAGSVPALSRSIVFPDAEPHILSPAFNDTLSRSTGFTLTWEGTNSDDAHIVMVDSTGCDSSSVVITENDGEYTFTPSQLGSMDPGGYVINLYLDHREEIDETGFDSRSFINAMVFTNVLIELE